MSVILKTLLGLFAIFCFMHCVEMARLARDTPPENNKNDFSETFAQFADKMKKAIDSPDFQNFISGASKSLSDGTKTLQEQFTELGKKVTEAVQSAAAQSQDAKS